MTKVVAEPEQLLAPHAAVMCSAVQDVNREVDQLQVDIADCERWRDRFYDAIHQGSVLMVRTDYSFGPKASGGSTLLFFFFLCQLIIL
jgi:hypothetical protein